MNLGFIRIVIKLRKVLNASPKVTNKHLNLSEKKLVRETSKRLMLGGLYHTKAWRTNKKIVVIESDDWGAITNVW